MKIGSDVLGKKNAAKVKKLFIRRKPKPNLQEVKEKIDAELKVAQEHKEDVQKNWKHHESLTEAKREVSEAEREVSGLKVLDKVAEQVAKVDEPKAPRKQKSQMIEPKQETEEGGEVSAEKSKDKKGEDELEGEVIE